MERFETVDVNCVRMYKYYMGDVKKKEDKK